MWKAKQATKSPTTAHAAFRATNAVNTEHINLGVHECALLLLSLTCADAAALV